MPGDKVRWVVTNRPDAYVMASGESFWGGAKDHDQRSALLVEPIDVEALVDDAGSLRRAMDRSLAVRCIVAALALVSGLLLGVLL